MRKVKVKKIFKGFVSIKDYLVWKAIEKNECLIVQYEDKEMVLTPNDLKRYCQLTDKFFLKKFKKPGENPFYRLLDYKWNPSTPLKLF